CPNSRRWPTRTTRSSSDISMPTSRRCWWRRCAKSSAAATCARCRCNRRNSDMSEFEAAAAACTQGSDAGTMTFPQVLDTLQQVGVERYTADLVRGEKTYYRRDGGSCVVGGRTTGLQPATVFDAAAIEAAIRASQTRAIDYTEFCRRVMQAGC